MNRYSVFGAVINADRTFRTHMLGTRRPSGLHIQRGVYAAIVGGLEGQRLVYAGGRKSATGGRGVRLYENAQAYVLLFGERIAFKIGRDVIQYGVRDECDEQLIESCLFGQVLSFWFEMHNDLMLHASSVEIDDAAVLFLGGKGAGKTSMAAAFVRNGFRLISDDLVRVRRRNQQFIVEPSYPQLKMVRDQVEHFIGIEQEKGADRLQKYFGKYWIPVGGNGVFGTFCGERKRIAAIYILERERSGSGAGEVFFERLSSKAALIEVIGGSFLGRVVDAAGFQARRVGTMARLAEEVPVRKIRYSTGLQYLGEVVSDIVEDMRKGGMESQKRAV